MGRQSDVDESLFGNSKPGGKPGATAQVETLEATRSAGQAPPEVVTLTRGELHRMMGASPIISLPQAAALKKAAQLKKDEERRVSNARKARMLALEEERKKQEVPNESTLLKQQADVATLTHAEKLLREQQDEAKAMNQMMLYSKCVTIRDAQLREKKHMMLEEEEDQRRLDLMMEIERIKALENFEERERQRRDERMKGATVLQVRACAHACVRTQHIRWCGDPESQSAGALPAPCCRLFQGSVYTQRVWSVLTTTDRMPPSSLVDSQQTRSRSSPDTHSLNCAGSIGRATP